MFPSTSSRETLRLSGKQNSLFPSGAHIKCIILFAHHNPSLNISLQFRTECVEFAKVEKGTKFS